MTICLVATRPPDGVEVHAIAGSWSLFLDMTRICDIGKHIDRSIVIANHTSFECKYTWALHGSKLSQYIGVFKRHLGVCSLMSGIKGVVSVNSNFLVALQTGIFCLSHVDLLITTSRRDQP